MILKSVFIISCITIALIQIIQLKKCLVLCTDKHNIAISIASCFISFTLPISIVHTMEHLNYYVKPNLQAHIIRIIWMVPVFALKSFLSIVFVEQSFYFQAFREIYEAYVIYSFMRYLLNFLGDRYHPHSTVIYRLKFALALLIYLHRAGSMTLSDKLSSLPSALGFHRIPFCFLNPWQMGNEFLRRCKIGVFQYVIVRSLSTAISLILFYFGLYNINDDSWTSLPSLIILINSISQSWALYTLMLFYQVAQKPLVNMMPFYKFFCIKFVVFFTWWQSILLYILVFFGQIHSSHEHSTKEVGALIHDLLITIEMSVAAIGFLHSFSTLDFQISKKNKLNGSNADIATASPGSLALAKNKSEMELLDHIDMSRDDDDGLLSSASTSNNSLNYYIDFLRDCCLGYSHESDEPFRLLHDDNWKRVSTSAGVVHTTANKDISKSSLGVIGVEMSPYNGEALYFTDAVFHVMIQTEVINDLKDVAGHGYDKFIKEWMAYLRRRCIKEQSSTIH